MTATLALSLWASILSTGLAGIKIWEVWCDRFRLTTSYAFGMPEYGNEVIIENATGTPVMMSYWELLMMGGSRWHRREVYGKYPNEGYCNITIGPHSRYTLAFKDKDYFRWPYDGADELVLRVHVAGRRRPVDLSVERIPENGNQFNR